MTSDLQKLNAAIQQVNDMVRQVATEKNRHAAVETYMNDLRVGRDQYGNRTVPDVLLGVAATINGRIKAELIAEVERRHAADLIDRARKLEALRAIIPSLAAKAAIEIGETARQLQREGSSHDQ